MRYFDDDYRKKSGSKVSYPCIVFDKDNWDDFGYKTTYKAYHYTNFSTYEEVGDIKILDLTTKSTILEGSFSSLDEEKCSLGQSLEYYDNIKRLFPDSFEAILKSLNDISFFKDIATRFENTE